MKRSFCTAVLILVIVGHIAPVYGQAATPSHVDAEILWQFDTGG